MLGTVVGSYRITGQIAVGGMGTVYRAEHTLIGRIAAIKVLHPEMTTSREIVTRFFNEAKATSGIKHPGIVEVFDFGYMPSGHAYLVMEYLEGETLSQRMKARGTLSEGEAAMLMRGVCSALAAAHAKGVVHRDLKPDNIFVVPEPDSPIGERTKILDFGIAKLTEVGEGNQHTKAGAVMGTPTYMSPEQCRGTGQVDHRADLYSIGCMLYELVIGRPPFAQTGAGELLGAHLFVEPDPPSRHGRISQELEALVMRLLDKKPENRVQTASELAQHLIGIAQSSGWIAVANTDPGSRFSLAHVSPPAGAHFTPSGIGAGAVTEFTPHHLTPAVNRMTPAHYTPAHHTPAHYTPAHYTPAHYTPMQLPPQAPTTLAPPPPEPPKPTTLSGSASEQHDRAPHVHTSRRGLSIAIGAALLAAAAGIAFVIATSGKKDEIQPATTEPTPTATGPAVVPPNEVAPSETKPADDKTAKTGTDAATTDTKATNTTTTDTKTTDTKSTDTKSTDTKATDTKATDTKSTDTKSTDTESTDTKSTDKKTTDTKSIDKKATDKKTTDMKSTDKKTTDTKSTDTKSTDKKT
ncbi:MAG: serine/threonine protein kinase, partial [Kofleriaceae bacterium]